MNIWEGEEDCVLGSVIKCVFMDNEANATYHYLWTKMMETIIWGE